MPCPALIREPQPSVRGITYLGRSTPTTWNVGEPQTNRWLVILQENYSESSPINLVSPSVNGVASTNLVSTVLNETGYYLASRIDTIQLPLDTDSITITGGIAAGLFILGGVSNALTRTNTSVPNYTPSTTVNHTRGAFGAGMIGLAAMEYDDPWTPSGVQTAYFGSGSGFRLVYWPVVNANSVTYGIYGEVISMCTWNYSY